MLEVPNFHYERVSSTNDVAKELLFKYDCLFVSADYQYNGRGRKGRSWEGESHKNIYLSFGVNETKQEFIKNKILYQIIGCLAVESTLSEFATGAKIKLKYPNDVYIANEKNEYKKISGVLAEHSYSGNICTESVLGIGININQIVFDKSVAEKATSLKLLGYNCDTDNILDSLKSNILKFMQSNEEETFGLWKKKIDLVGKNIIVVSNGVEYKVDTISPFGTLLASNHNGHITINNGDSIIYEL